MNLPSFEDVELMFYHNQLTAYHWTLAEDDLKRLMKQQVPIAVFRNRGPYQVPAYLASYPSLFVIDQELR